MRADQIIKNAKIFTSDKNRPMAAALAVKDGKFIYVGDEAGLSEYEGEVRDLDGRFVMPGLIDSHVHVTMGAGFEYTDLGPFVECDSKQGALDFMADYIKQNPGRKRPIKITDSKIGKNSDDNCQRETPVTGKPS